MKRQMIGLSVLALVLFVGGQRATAFPLYAGQLNGGTCCDFGVVSEVDASVTGFTEGTASPRNSLAYDPATNTIYGGGSMLHTVDPATGLSTDIGTMGLSGTTSLAFDTRRNTLWAGSGGGSIAKIDTSSGAIIGSAIPVGIGVNGMAYDPLSDTLYGIHEVGVTIYSINTASGATTIVPHSLPGLEWGSLAFDVETKLLYTVKCCTPSGELYSVDPTIGTTTFVGNTHVGSQFERITSLAPTAIPEPASMALLGLGGLLALARRRRG